MSKNIQYKVLWIEDNLDIVESKRIVARKYNIDLRHVDNWKSAIESLNSNFDEYSAIIIEPDRMDIDSNLYMDLYRVFKKNGKMIPWYIYTVSVSLKYYGGLLNNIFSYQSKRDVDWGPMVFSKVSRDPYHNFDALCRTILNTIKAQAVVVNEISEDAKKIINKFKASYIVNNDDDGIVDLMVSLYRMKSEGGGNEHGVVGIDLDKYKIDLSKYLEESEIELLLQEYDNLVSYEYSHYHRFYDKFKKIDSFVDLFRNITHVASNSRVYLPLLHRNSIFSYQIGCQYDVFSYNVSNDEEPFDDINLVMSYLYGQIYKCNSNITVYDSIEAALVAEFKNDEQQYNYILNTNFYPFKYECDFVRLLVSTKLCLNGEIWLYLPLKYCYQMVFSEEFYSFIKGRGCTIQIMELPNTMSYIEKERACVLRIIKNGIEAIELYDFSKIKLLKDSCGVDVLNNDIDYENIQLKLKKKSKEYSLVGSWESLKSKRLLYPSGQIALNQLYEKEDSSKNYRFVSELVSYVDLSQEECNNLPMIGMKELSDNAFLCDVEYRNLSICHETDRILGYLTEDRVLIGYNGGQFKVGKTQGLSVDRGCLLDSGIYAVKVNTEILDVDYLLHMLLSEEVTHLVNIISSGLQSDINVKNIFEYLRIECPSLEEQKEIVNNAIKSSLSDSERKLKEAYEEYVHETHMKRHAMSQTISNLVNRWDIIKIGIQHGKITWDHDFMFDLFDESENDVLNDINNTILRLQMQITKFDPGYTMKEENISLIRSINDYISKNKSAIFSYDFQKDDNWDKNFGMIKFSNDALILIFDNIKNNACYHGFKNIKSKDHVLKIELSRIGESYELLISNNGEALNSNMDEKKVLFYGESSKFNKLEDGHVHCGIGGYEVSKLMQKFGGTAEFISTPNEIFKVTYKLIFKNI